MSATDIPHLDVDPFSLEFFGHDGESVAVTRHCVTLLLPCVISRAAR